MDTGTSPYDETYIQAGLIYPMVNNVAPYRCPADTSVYPANSSFGKPRVRSMSMNCWLNPITSWNSQEGYSGPTALRDFRKTMDMVSSLGTSMTFVFIDENPNTIDDSYFVCDPNQKDYWANCPATYHNHAGGVSFADGHAEIKKWIDSQLLTHAQLNGMASDPNSGDLAWLQQRSSSH
jgi:prepilin-type processing-associated H-X9-DG protein